MSLVTKEMKGQAEIYHGDETCRGKLILWLKETGFPNGLIAIEDDIEECGCIKDIGFVWLKHRQRKEKWYDNMVVRYETEITAYIEHNKIKGLTGVKAKGFLFWVGLSEIHVNNLQQGLITFKTQAGFSMSFPKSMFLVQEKKMEELEDI